LDRKRNKSLSATGSTLGVPFGLVLKAETLHLADRTLEALDAIGEANMLAESFGESKNRAVENRGLG
jgi:hypothetical protein